MVGSGAGFSEWSDKDTDPIFFNRTVLPMFIIGENILASNNFSNIFIFQHILGEKDGELYKVGSG